LFYIHYFRDLEKDFPNFKFYLVLSEPLPEDNWTEKKDMNDKNWRWICWICSPSSNRSSILTAMNLPKT
jgi:Na+-transporting NADH:ubiquinone oxidoreductase, subunit NqrF